MVKTSRQLADETLSRFGVKLPPVPIEDIIVGMGHGFSIETQSTTQCRVELPMLPRTTGGHIMTCHSSPWPQRFALAHGLGHIMAHEGSDGCPHDFNRGREGDIEDVANEFALHLLMPLWMVEESIHIIRTQPWWAFWRGHDHDGLVRQMMSAFRASEGAINLRLSRL